MPYPRTLASIFLLACSAAQAQIAITPIPDVTVPSGKTLVVPIPAADTTGSARSYTVTLGQPTLSGTTTPASAAGVHAVIRTGDPHFILGVSYFLGSGSTAVLQTGTMDFQLLREFAPVATQLIAGLTEGGFYSPSATGTSGSTKFITFHRVLAGSPPFIIQGGDPNGNGTGGPGFSFANENSSALIFSGTAGQLAMANGGSGIRFPSNSTPTTVSQGTNGSNFFVTLQSDRPDLDFGYTIFGQLIRGYDTLNGIAGIDVGFNSSGELSSPVMPVDITSANIAQNNTDALLILSATGVCDVSGTITATTPDGAVTSQPFLVHVVADDVNDPPFLDPVPDGVAPNGTAKVVLSGSDLQLDLLRYGNVNILPALSNNITSGTSPIQLIPLVSNTDNTIAATIDHYNPTPLGVIAQGDRDNSLAQGLEGSTLVRNFHIGAGDVPIRGALSPIPAGDMGSLKVPASAVTPLAVFVTANRRDTPAKFTADVNWGDGTYLVTGSGVTIAADGVDRFKLLSTHTYTQPGEYPIFVDIADSGGARLHLTGTANLSGSSSGIAISAPDFTSPRLALKNAIVATFKDNGGPRSPSLYSATINWGDGAASPATLVAAPAGTFRVLGSHTYQSPESYTVSTSVSSGSSSAVAWSTAHITGTAPQIFPPFPQSHLAQIWSSVTTSSDTVDSTGSDGGNPFAGVVSGSDGNLYGTTVHGGTGADGAIYQLTASGSINTLYSFTGGNDGANPYAALIQAGTNGFFYGTALTGGTNGDGAIFQIDSSGSFSLLYAFTSGTDGSAPRAALVEGTNGLLYGTTSAGGPSNRGAVYDVSISGSTAGAVSVIHTFAGGVDGSDPYASLYLASDGNFYGTTTSGGAFGAGVVYQVTPAGVFTPIYSFVSGNVGDGSNPESALVQDGTSGLLYGTAETGGSNGAGTVYSITTTGSLTVLHAFSGGADGGNPIAALTTEAITFGTDGNLYGTTSTGGADGYGTVFSITTSGSLTTLYSFTHLGDGANPAGTLLPTFFSTIPPAPPSLSFYGTTQNGGAGFGTVYQIVASGSVATIDTLHTFTSGTGFQISVDAAVALVNSGNRPTPAESGSNPLVCGTFSVVLASGTTSFPSAPLSFNGQTDFNIPILQPGQHVIYSFPLNGSTDYRLKLPVGIAPGSGQPLTGVVTYHDPVGDFDGAARTYSPFSF